jgi:hypothetical protein
MRGPVVSILIVNWNTRERVMRVSLPCRDVQLARSFADRGFTLWVTPSAQVIHDAHSSIRCLAHPASSNTSAPCSWPPTCSRQVEATELMHWNGPMT